jgi:ribosomal protein S27AE
MTSSASHKQKVYARGAVQNLIKSGKLLRQPCEVCGETRVEAHHDDYSKPLEIRWLCIPCHRDAHQNEICKHGHLLTPDNIYTPPNSNRRDCKQCRADRARQIELVRKQVGRVRNRRSETSTHRHHHNDDASAAS